MDALAAAMRADSNLAMATLATPIVDADEWGNPNVVKVVCDYRGDALYFSRSPIPFLCDGGIPANALRHIGVYGYRRHFLLQFATLRPGVLEQIEKLEQLRALEAGMTIAVARVDSVPLSVDTEEDLKKARELMSREKK